MHPGIFDGPKSAVPTQAHKYRKERELRNIPFCMGNLCKLSVINKQYEMFFNFYSCLKHTLFTHYLHCPLFPEISGVWRSFSAR